MGRSARPSYPASAASRSLTSMIEGLVSAEPSANRTVGTVWLPLLTLITIVGGGVVVLDVDHLVGDTVPLELGLEAVAVATPGR